MKIGQTYQVMKQGDHSVPKKGAIIRITDKIGTKYYYEIVDGEMGEEETTITFREDSNFATSGYLRPIELNQEALIFN